MGLWDRRVILFDRGSFVFEVMPGYVFSRNSLKTFLSFSPLVFQLVEFRAAPCPPRRRTGAGKQLRWAEKRRGGAGNKRGLLRLNKLRLFWCFCCTFLFQVDHDRNKQSHLVVTILMFSLLINFLLFYNHQILCILFFTPVSNCEIHLAFNVRNKIMKYRVWVLWHFMHVFHRVSARLLLVVWRIIAWSDT